MKIVKPQQKECAICGAPLRGLWIQKIAGGTKICRQCTDFIRIDSARLPYISLSEAKARAQRGRDNYEKLKTFHVTDEKIAVDFRFRYDRDNEEWYITNSKKQFNPQIYRISDIKSCKLTENGTVIWEKDYRIPAKTFDHPDYLEYGRMYSFRFFFDIVGVEDFLEIELVNDNAHDVYPGTRLYEAYQEEAQEWTNLLSEILN